MRALMIACLITGCASEAPDGAAIEQDIGDGEDWECHWDEESQQCICTASPIIFDLAGDGIHLTSAADGVVFSLHGGPAQWAWTEPGTDDAWLVMDRNGDGLIDSGHEMFGDQTSQATRHNPNGFAALAEFDDNGDGIINAADTVWSELRLWSDKNHDGGSFGELTTLGAAGIQSISLSYAPTSIVDAHGNQFRYASAITAAAPVGGAIYDVWLQRGVTPPDAAAVGGGASFTLYTCWAWNYAVWHPIPGNGVTQACDNEFVHNDPLVGKPGGGLGELARLVARFSTSSVSEDDAYLRAINTEIGAMRGHTGGSLCFGAGFPDPDYLPPPYVILGNASGRAKCTSQGGGGSGGGSCFAGPRRAKGRGV